MIQAWYQKKSVQNFGNKDYSRTLALRCGVTGVQARGTDGTGRVARVGDTSGTVSGVYGFWGTGGREGTGVTSQAQVVRVGYRWTQWRVRAHGAGGPLQLASEFHEGVRGAMVCMRVRLWGGTWCCQGDAARDPAKGGAVD